MTDIVSTGAVTTLIQVVIIDLVLAGDNAVVIGLAAGSLPSEQRKRAILIGILAATAFRPRPWSAPVHRANGNRGQFDKPIASEAPLDRLSRPGSHSLCGLRNDLSRQLRSEVGDRRSDVSMMSKPGFIWRLQIAVIL